MSNLSDRMYAQARIIPIQQKNRVREVKKMESGSLWVALNSGDTFEIDTGDALFQLFLIYTVLADV